MVSLLTLLVLLCLSIYSNLIIGSAGLTCFIQFWCRFILAFLVYAGINVILVMLAALLCVYIGPSAAGSGIPEVKAYLNGVDTPNIFSLKTLIVKVR